MTSPATIAIDNGSLGFATAFCAPRDRDAWSTIRGFVFQADLTIERWLDLDADQELQLECGEDIDTVTRYLQMGDEVRLLEQIKHRETNITLKTGGPLSALANAVGHRHANPGQKLLFRFTSNARPGKEKLSPFAGLLTGIGAWQSLWTAGTGATCLTGGEETHLIAGIRTILSLATRPEDLPEEAWNQFQGLLATADEVTLRSFIQAFEWSLGAAEAEDMSDRIQRVLLERGLAADASVAYAQYQRLFLSVLKTLSRRIGKRLTRQDLEAVLVQPVSEADQKFFDSFLSQMGLLDRRIAFLQAQIGHQTGMLDTITEQIGRIIDLSRMQALTLSAPIPIFEPPPPEENVSPRIQAVGSLAHELTTASWLALAGGSGTGKSYLALLLAARADNCPVWLRFRGLSSEQAAAALDAVFLFLNDAQVLSNRREWYLAVCRRFGAGALLVLDDLPPMVSGDALAQRLELLAHACRDAGTKMITTAVNQLPGALLRLARGLVSPQSAPPLSEVDALEILQGYGAPPGVLGDIRKVRFLNNVSRLHPALLSAVAIYLREQGWSWTDQQLSDLMLGRFAGDLNEETVGRLLATVTNEQSRELLYRLNLVFGAIDMETVRHLASVDPAVPHPRERITALTGLWLQRETGETLRVSPLISVLKSEDLAEGVRQDCHRVLAQQAIHKGRVTTNDLQNAITHLAAAQEHEQAVLLLVLGLSQIQTALQAGELSKPKAKRTGLLALLWGTPVAEAVSLNSRLLLRAFQVLLGVEIGADTSYVAADLARQVDAAGIPEATGLLAAAFFAAPHLALSDFEASCRCLVRAAAVLPQATLPDGSPFDLPPKFTAGSMLWLNLTGIRTKAEVMRWLDMLGQVPPEVRRQTLADRSLGDQGLFLLMDRFWLTEARRPLPEQDWDRLLADMDAIEGKARAVGAEFLQATAIRAKILILCEHVKDPDRALAIAEDGLARLPDDPRIRFTLCDAMGRKLSFLDGREHEAQRWLRRAEEACEYLPDSLPYERAMTLLALARLADKQGEAGEVVAILTRAVDMVGAMPFLSEIELVKMQGDLAIGQWKQGDQAGAFAALDAGALRLLALKQDSNEWKALFALFGHTAGYMAGHMRGQTLRLVDGEPYVLPPLGNFHDSNEEGFAKAYQPDTDVLLPAILARLALAVGQDDRTAYWANRTIETAKNTPGAAIILATTVVDLLPSFLLGGRFSEFFDSVREATFTLTAAMCLHNQVGDAPLIAEMDVEALLGGQGSEHWEMAETAMLGSVLVPLALHLGTLALQARRDAVAEGQLIRSVSTCTSLCQEMAAISTRPDAWREAASLLEGSFLGSSRMESVVATANSFGADDTALKALAYIGATLERGVSLREACRGQMAVLFYCLQFLAGEASQRLLLVPFLEEFWGQALAKSRILFTPPRLVEQEFKQACEALETQKAKRIMQAMASGLGVRHDPVVESGFNKWDAAERKRS